MENLTFWNDGGMVQSIGSIEEIRGHMDEHLAYRVLLGVCYRRDEYDETNGVCYEIMDEKHHRIRCTPLEAADKLDRADVHLPMQEDIFRFVEKAYRDHFALTEDRWSAFRLGCLYSQERYGHIDYPKAAKFFTVSADAGAGEAEAMLGKLYLLGLGVPKNYEKAFHYLTKWALLETENTEALCLLGDMYRLGLYVEKDMEQAREIYCRAWHRDAGERIVSPQLCLRLAEYEMIEEGKPADPQWALRYYQRAECDFYTYLRSHPREAGDGLRQARAGQEAARQKLEAAIDGREKAR